MFGLKTLFASVARLAASFAATADTVDEVNARIRQRFGLDDLEPLPSPAQRVEIEAATETNGHGRRKAARS